MNNYEKLVERISNSSNLPIEEIERKVEAKKAKLSGLISKEGAAQIIAAELGINFDSEILKISELVQGMKRANVIGKIIKLNPVKEYNKNNKQGKIGSFLLADETSNIRTVLWDTNHIALIEQGKIKENSVIEISNAYVRNNELHLSSFADIKLSNEKISNPVLERAFQTKKLKDAKTGETIKTRAIIVNMFEPKYFEVNPETGKKFTEEDRNNRLLPKKRALLNLILDDGTETIRSVAFGEQINSLGLTDEQIFSPDEFIKIKSSLLGEEKHFAGQIRLNSFSNTNELTIQEVHDVNPDELIKELDAKA